MDVTPHYTPKSPFQYSPNTEALYGYPSPTESTSRYQSADSFQGVGAYSCAMGGSTTENRASSILDRLPTATNNTWPAATSLQNRNPPSSSSSTPNILSAEYDPFAPCLPLSSLAFTHDIFPSQTASVVGVLPGSSLPSGNTSQRSSISSTPSSETFTQTGSIQSYTPRIKMEEPTDYSLGNEPIMLSSPQLGQSLMGTSTNAYPGSLEATYYHDPSPMTWSKIEYSSNQDLPSISSLPIPPYDRRSESQELASVNSQDPRRSFSTISRTRQPRKLTTKEEANFICPVKGCGKLFGRSYNYKAHMETHDASREYPFPCPMKQCNKKFVRKTDLQRHHQSVHMKQRNHKCDYCSRYFARKDTLRRHMEDGCSKRFDIETLDFRPQGYATADSEQSRQNSSSSSAHRPLASQSRHPSYSSSAQYSPPPPPPLASHGHPATQTQHHHQQQQHHHHHHHQLHPASHESTSTLTSASGPYLGRHEYGGPGEDSHHVPVWSH